MILTILKISTIKMAIKIKYGFMDKKYGAIRKVDTLTLSQIYPTRLNFNTPKQSAILELWEPGTFETSKYRLR